MNQLALEIQKRKIDKPIAEILLKNFQDFFKEAAEWEEKAIMICVVNENQTEDMKKARELRLSIAKRRVAVEKARKKLKEDSLRQGKAIDGIANILKAIFEPLEKHLYLQEKFVELREAKILREAQEKADAIEEKKLLALQEKEAKKQERLLEENVKLKEDLRIGEEKEKEQKVVIEEQTQNLTSLEDMIEENKTVRREMAMVKCPECGKCFIPGEVEEEDEQESEKG